MYSGNLLSVVAGKSRWLEGEIRIKSLLPLFGFIALVAATSTKRGTSFASVPQTFGVADLRAAIVNARPNSRVNIPAGVYDLGDRGIRIEGKRNVQLVGAGEGKTILRAGPSAAYILELAGSNDNLTVANMSLEGATSGNHLDNIQDVVTPTGVTSGSGYGIHNDGCSNVLIADNVIRNADRHSIYQASAYQPDRPAASGSIVIERNVIIDHAKTSSLTNDWLVAIVVARSSNVTVANNEIVNPNHDAISIENPPQEGARIFTPVRFLPFGHTEFSQPPDSLSLRSAAITHIPRAEVPMPGLRAVLYHDRHPILFIVDTRMLTLAERGMRGATAMGLDISRADFLKALDLASLHSALKGLGVVIYDP